MGVDSPVKGDLLDVDQHRLSYGVGAPTRGLEISLRVREPDETERLSRSRLSGRGLSVHASYGLAVHISGNVVGLLGQTP